MELCLIPFVQKLSRNSKDDEEGGYNIVRANDYASECIKDEMSHFQTEGKLKRLDICSAFHGGPLDYPKVTNEAAGLVSCKWDICFKKILLNKEVNRMKKEETRMNCTDSDEEVFAKISTNVDDGEDYEDFISTVNECAEKLLAHSIQLINNLLIDGNLHSLLTLLGGVSFIRNKMWYFNQTLPKSFDGTYSQYCRLIDSFSEQILEYFSTTVSTTILHDAESQDWSGKGEFYEGEKISHCVRMWGFVLRGFKTDLWATVPPKTAQKIYASVFDESLGLLTARYCAAAPTHERLTQYRGDISYILSFVKNNLKCLVVGTNQNTFSLNNYVPHLDNRAIWSIRNKAWTLHQCLTIIGTPPDNLDILKEPSKRESTSRRTSLYTFMSKESEKDQSDLLVEIISENPEPVWPLIIQLIAFRKKTISLNILEKIGGLIPVIKDNSITGMECGGIQCSHSCLKEGLEWPVLASFGIFKILSKISETDALKTGLFRILKNNSLSWEEALSIADIFNTTKKPAWYRGLVHLLEPFLISVFSELVDMMASGEAWTESHVPKALDKTVGYLADTVILIPISVLKALQSLEDLSNGQGCPLGGSVTLHFIISCFYGILKRFQHLLEKEKIQREKINFIVAFGKALSSLDKSSEFKSIKTQIAGLINQEETEGKSLNFPDGLDNEFSYIVAENVANDLLGDESGRFACIALYEFIRTNPEWIRNLNTNKDIELKSSCSIDPGFFRADESDTALLNREYPWKEMMCHIRDNSHPSIILRLLLRRHEIVYAQKESSDSARIQSILQKLRVECL